MMPGHSDITTTARYAHALVKDVRAAMEAASRHTIPTEPQVAVARSLEKRVIEVLNLVPKQVLQ